MCGRGASTLSADRCCRIAGGARVRNRSRFRTKYNLGPQGFLPVVTSRQTRGDLEKDEKDAKGGKQQLEREVTTMKWGLVPSFAKRPEEYDVFKGGSSTFNARVEGVDSSNLWKRLVDKKRCVVLLDGFYEWRTVGKNKVPMFIRNPDEFAGHTISSTSSTAKIAKEDEMVAEKLANAVSDQSEDGPKHAALMMAALYDTWSPNDKKADDMQSEADTVEPLETVTILTMDSDGTPVSSVHDRMPVFLTPETAASWLDTSQLFSTVIKPVTSTAHAHARQLLIYEVPPMVSNIRNDSPDCMLPKKDYDKKQFSLGLGKFFTKKPAESKLEAAVAEKRMRSEETAQASPPAKVAKVDSGLSPLYKELLTATIDLDD